MKGTIVSSFEDNLVTEYQDLLTHIEESEKYMETIVRGITVTDAQYRMIMTHYNIMLAYEQILRLRLEDLGIEY